MKRHGRISQKALLGGVLAGSICVAFAEAGSIVFVQCGPPCDNQMPQPNIDYVESCAAAIDTDGDVDANDLLLVISN